MIRALAALVGVHLAAAALAEGGGVPPEADVAALAGALLAQGCDVDPASADALVAASGLTVEAARAVIGHLTDEGLLEIQSDPPRLRLVGLGCPAG